MPKIKRSESQRSGIKIFHDEKSGLKNQPDKRKVKKIESKKDRPVRAASLKDSPDLSASQFIKKLVEVDKQIELVYMKTLKKWDLTMNAFLALESLRDHSQGIEPACLAEDLGVQRQLVTILYWFHLIFRELVLTEKVKTTKIHHCFTGARQNGRNYGLQPLTKRT